jgi:hypothetical protein
MGGSALVAGLLGRVRDIVRNTLKDLTPNELVAGPKPHHLLTRWVESTYYQDLLVAP